MKTRLPEIDLIRGLAMVAMVLIHTTVFYVSNPIAFFLWNYSQWAVPAFIFCSGYLFFQKTQNIHLNYFKKRFLRLLIPYWIFLPFFFIVLLITNPHQLTSNYMLQSIFLTGGVQINWMVLLFLQLAILLPILSWMESRHKILFWMYSIVAIGSGILFLFWKFPFDWRFIMWLPWSTFILLALFFVKYELRKKFIILFLSFIIYLLSLFIVRYLGHSMSFYDNKYPPNIFIISFGIAVINGFYFVKQLPRLKFTLGEVEWARNDNKVKSLLVFLSRYSYSIYFIHYLILSLFTPWVEKLRSVWFFLFFLVFIPTILIQKLILRHKR